MVANERKRSISLTIRGELLGKSNSRRLVRIGGKPRLIKSPAALEFLKGAMIQLRPKLVNHHAFTGPVRMDIIIHYKTKRPDLDVSLIQDILEQKKSKETGQVTFEGVYLNDRQVHEIHAYKQYDKEDPRLDVTITEL